MKHAIAITVLSYSISILSLIGAHIYLDNKVKEHEVILGCFVDYGLITETYDQSYREKALHKCLDTLVEKHVIVLK